MGFLSDLFLCKCLEGKKKRTHVEDDEEDEEDESEGLFFKLQTLQIATNFFSEINRLGHGGFGPVYVGLLSNGEEIAVKKLSLNSRQGVREFTNEVKLLLKIEHKNLVRLLGCCIEGPEKMLVYEYLPNKSLDNFLFDKDKRAMLDWRKRYEIIIGVARGLLYLHEESPERIIHRDIKASNILLDGQLKPKISDFGLARLFPWDDTHVSTFRISGTYGYMAPEYAMHGYLSAKTDVFSYGILVLEIVSGRKNYEGQLDEGEADLLSYTWTLWQEGKTLELVDPSLGTTLINQDEVAMCIQLGLLCCQANIAERPDMNSVHLTLVSDSFNIPKPGKPGIQGRRGRWTTSTSTAPMTTTNNTTDDHTNSTASTTAAVSNAANYSNTSSLDDLVK
ncbi:Protein kinase domain [Macleaya cordata]|uniref:Protein kinase domain n=1 Tax=Macleaya cordata TaxID=56857 RepID=A0A200Q3D0_MACCD|nr:Protein kinase domain [Macleaya cordata]